MDLANDMGCQTKGTITTTGIISPLISISLSLSIHDILFYSFVPLPFIVPSVLPLSPSFYLPSSYLSLLSSLYIFLFCFCFIFYNFLLYPLSCVISASLSWYPFNFYLHLASLHSPSSVILLASSPHCVAASLSLHISVIPSSPNVLFFLFVSVPPLSFPSLSIPTSFSLPPLVHFFYILYPPYHPFFLIHLICTRLSRSSRVSSSWETEIRLL